MTTDPQTEPEHVKLARWHLEKHIKDCEDYGVVVRDTDWTKLARAVLAQHAQIAELKAALTEALDLLDAINDGRDRPPYEEQIRLRKLVTP